MQPFFLAFKAFTCMLVASRLPDHGTVATGNEEPAIPFRHSYYAVTQDPPSPIIDFAALDNFPSEPMHPDFQWKHAGPSEVGHHSAGNHGGSPLFDPNQGLSANDEARSGQPPPANEETTARHASENLAEPSTIVPQIEPMTVDKFEKYTIGRLLAFRLAEAKIERTSLQFVPPKQPHQLALLREQLERQAESDRGVYLIANVEYSGHLIAVPIYSDEATAALMDINDPRKLGLAVLSARRGRPPKVHWVSYATLDVPDRADFIKRLERARNAKHLVEYLIPRA